MKNVLLSYKWEGSFCYTKQPEKHEALFGGSIFNTYICHAKGEHNSNYSLILIAPDEVKRVL